MEKTKRRLHYAFVILIACSIFNGATVAITTNCTGVFFSYVASDIGCRVSDIALFISICRIMQCVAMLFLAKKLVLKYPMKAVMIVASLLAGLRVLLAFSTSAWQWWVIAAAVGPTMAICDCFAATLMVERWFKKKLPLMLSILASFTGIFSILFSSLASSLIVSSGWRFAWLVISLILFFSTLVPSFFLSLDPSEKGMRPYGDDESSQIEIVETKPAEKAGPIPLEKNLVRIFILTLANAALISFVSCLTVYGQTINITAFAPALLVSAYSIGNISFKFVFGVMAEKLGLKKAAVFILMIVLAGVGLMTTGSDYVVFVGGVLFGGCASLFTAILPLVNKQVYPDRYATAVQITSVCYSILLAVMNYVQPLIYDITGSFTSVIIALAVLTATGIVMINLLFKNKQDDKQVA